MYGTYLATFAISQNVHPHTFPVVQMLDDSISPLVSIVSQLIVAQVKYHIHQWLWDDSYLKFVAIIYNGSKQHIILTK